MIEVMQYSLEIRERIPKRASDVATFESSPHLLGESEAANRKIWELIGQVHCACLSREDGCEQELNSSICHLSQRDHKDINKSSSHVGL